VLARERAHLHIRMAEGDLSAAGAAEAAQGLAAGQAQLLAKLCAASTLAWQHLDDVHRTLARAQRMARLLHPVALGGAGLLLGVVGVGLLENAAQRRSLLLAWAIAVAAWIVLDQFVLPRIDGTLHRRAHALLLQEADAGSKALTRAMQAVQYVVRLEAWTDRDRSGARLLTAFDQLHATFVLGPGRTPTIPTEGAAGLIPRPTASDRPSPVDVVDLDGPSNRMSQDTAPKG